MKPAPKYNTAKFSTNQRIGYWNELEIERRQKAIELSKTDFPHLKDKPIKYDLKR
jgi:hypothetical protein